MIEGKKNRKIYEEEIREVERIRGGRVEKRRIIGIGEGVLKDVKGDEDFGIDVIYI